MSKNNLFGDTIRSLGFLSRLPLPNSWFSDQTDSPSKSANAFPLAGAVLGLLGGLVLLLSYKLNLPPLVCSFLAVGTLIAATGALHEDGLGDTFDGFFGASTPERRLDIMKDSRIGTFAALALIIFVGLKVSLIAAIIERANINAAVAALIAAESVSRATMLFVWHTLPSVRPGGVSDSVGKPDWDNVMIAAFIGVLILALATIWVGGFAGFIVSITIVAASIYGFIKLCIAKIGGQTGDTLGATQQISAIAVLLGLVIVL